MAQPTNYNIDNTSKADNVIKKCANCVFSSNDNHFPKCTNKIVISNFPHLSDIKDGVFCSTCEASVNNQSCGVTGGYRLWQAKNVNLANNSLVKDAFRFAALQASLITSSYCNIAVEQAEVCNSETCNQHFFINRLSTQFKNNNLILPEANNLLKIEDSIIAKIPFYTFVICWILAIVSLLK